MTKTNNQEKSLNSNKKNPKKKQYFYVLSVFKDY